MRKIETKKIIIIAISMLLLSTAFSVARPVDTKTNNVPVSIGLAKDAVPTGMPPGVKPVSFYNPVKADVAYDPTAQLGYGPCEFNLATPGSITVLKQWGGPSQFLTGAAWTQNGKWYACDYSASASNIYRINPTTGDMTTIGTASVALHAMTYDGKTGVMYGSGGSGGLPTSLYTINPNTGAVTLVGAYGSSLQYMLSLACDRNGTMYGVDIATDNLYNINKTTGVATLIGALGYDLNYAQDMCYDIDNGLLYLASYCISPMIGGYLMLCDVHTGACTIVGQFQNAAEIDGFAIPNQAGVMLEIQNITGGLFTVKTSLTNSGTSAVTNVTWSIKFDGGTIIIPSGGEKTGAIASIAPAGAATIRSLVIGFGGIIKPLNITVSAQADNASPVSKTVPAKVLLFFVKI